MQGHTKENDQKTTGETAGSASKADNNGAAQQTTHKSAAESCADPAHSFGNVCSMTSRLMGRSVPVLSLVWHILFTSTVQLSGGLPNVTGLF